MHEALTLHTGKQSKKAPYIGRCAKAADGKTYSGLYCWPLAASLQPQPPASLVSRGQSIGLIVLEYADVLKMQYKGADGKMKAYSTRDLDYDVKQGYLSVVDGTPPHVHDLT